MADNQNLNPNPARQDRFFLRFGNIPSLPLLTPEEASEIDKLKLTREDKDFFHIALRSVQLPGIALGELKVDTMGIPFADTDMKFSFQPLNTEMKMDNNYILYKMLILWMFMIKHPENFSKYHMSKTFDLTNVDATLVTTNNFGDPVLSIELYELRPLSIPTIDLNYVSNGSEITLPITWSYSYFLPKTGQGDDYRFDF